MKLQDILTRRLPPEPWMEGDKIPWSDPDFSERMLKEHLSQRHDAASRRFEKIDRHVQWIHGHVLSEHPSRILDLGCGPGLYLQRLACLGHDCSGIDYAPASITYAQSAAEQAGLSIQYVHEDIRKATFGTDFDLVMLIWGEFNVFPPSDAEDILLKSHSALRGTGILLLEVDTFDAIRRQGQRPSSWYAAPAGLWSDAPHICLEENFWDMNRRAATTRYYVVDSITGEVAAHASSSQAYTDEEYDGLLGGSGFNVVDKHSSLTGKEHEESQDMVVLVARKQEAQRQW